MSTKKEIRRLVKERRALLRPEEETENSRKILESLLSLPEYKKARQVFCYVDYNHEVHTWPILERAMADGKRTAVPKVHGKDMVFYYIEKEEDLEPGYFGIREPKEGLPPAGGDSVLFIMPGVAFDRAHHRIGYGGGFYDRYLEAHPDLCTAAVAYECQIFDQVPFEEFDIRPSLLITEAGISRLEEA